MSSFKLAMQDVASSFVFVTSLISSKIIFLFSTFFYLILPDFLFRLGVTHIANELD